MSEAIKTEAVSTDSVKRIRSYTAEQRERRNELRQARRAIRPDKPWFPTEEQKRAKAIKVKAKYIPHPKPPRQSLEERRAKQAVRSRRNRDKNKNSIAEYKRKWHAAHREEMNSRNLARYYANHEKEKSIRRASYNNKPDEQKKSDAKAFYVANKEKIDERARKYAASNREKVLAAKREHYSRNREEMKERDRIRNADPVRREKARLRAKAWLAIPENLERHRESARERRANNREQHNARSRAYGKTQNGRLSKLNIKHKRRAKVKSGNVTTAELAALKRLAKGRCYYCRKKRPLTLDHIIPLGTVGTHTKDNIIFACGECNSSKGAKDPHEWARERHGLLIV